MSFLDNEEVLGYVPVAANSVVKVTIGKATYKSKKGKPIVDVRMCTRDFGKTVDSYAVQQQIIKQGFSTEGMSPTKKGLHLEQEDFKELMEKFLIPLYNTLVIE